MEEPRRVKSKMKKCDPTNFTIHDFLAECKTSDVADSRFEDATPETARASTNFFVAGAPVGKLGNLYTRVAELLGEQPGWEQKHDAGGRFHLILGGARGAGIPFKRFAQLFKWDYGITPHCNYFRGHVWITHKVKLVQTLRQANLQGLMPESFLFFPSSAEDNETEELRIASESGSKRAAAAANTWLCKASDASRGERTVLLSGLDEVLAHLEAQDKTSAAWCVQRYVPDPLLLPGGRKFDLRFLALVDKDLNGYSCSAPLVKTCTAPFSLANLSDHAAHLSAAAVQGRAATAPADADMPAEQLAKWLSADHNMNLERDVCVPARQAMARVLAAARPKLENVAHADFTSFQVLAFDFLLDSKGKLWLLEIAAPTDVPEDMCAELAADVVQLAVDPVFRGTSAVSDGVHFKRLEAAASASSSSSSSNNKK